MNVSQFLTDPRVVNALSAVNPRKQEFYVKEFARRFEEDTMYAVIDQYIEAALSRRCLELLPVAKGLRDACVEFGLRHEVPRPTKSEMSAAKRAQTIATIQALIATL